MIPIRVNITGDVVPGRREQKLMDLPNKLANIKDFVIEDVAPATQRMLKRHWDTKGSAFGHKWAPWSPRTLLDRLRKGNADKGLLRDTDDLFRSIFRNRARLLSKVRGGFRLSIDTGMRYAVFHQVGTSFMPERQVIPDPLPGVFMIEVRRMFRAWLLRD